MIRNINKSISVNRFALVFLQRISTSKQFKQKLAEKKYFEILGIRDNERINYLGKDLHRAYLTQIKKFHSDGMLTQEARKQFDQCTKCINEAYNQLKKTQGLGSDDIMGTKAFTDEELVSKQLFGKSYVDIMYTLYAPGNEEMRKKFIIQLQKRRQANHSDAYQDSSSQTNKNTTSQRGNNNQNYNTSSKSQTSQIRGQQIVFLGAILFAAFVPFFIIQNRKKVVNGVVIDDYQPKQHKVREYSQKQYDIIHLNSRKIAAQPLQRFYNKLLKFRPHMLIYPFGQDADIIQQLATYSIAPDIRLYEVSSKYFIDKKEYERLIEANNVVEIPKYELKETKPNTLMTLSLEAQRALHNIYINVDDLLAEIKETGKFTPPKIFFQFHGYMMCQIRDKPFSNLINYRNTRYISLFQMYFDYYSPIFFKRDYYKEYLVGYREQDARLHTRYFGNVYLNHRQIPSRYLKKGQKVVIMKEYKTCLNRYNHLKQSESKYSQDWQNYYMNFQKNWKKYCTIQINKQINQQ